MRAKVRHNTQAEEAIIQRGIAADPENPEWTEDDFGAARPAAEMMLPETYKALAERRVRGLQRAPTKEAVSLRLDRDVLEHLRATGPGWQTRAAEMLRRAVLG